MATDPRRLLCISLHDVAPATFEDCAHALDFLDDLRIGPVALLVVPDYHGLGRADRDCRFASFIESRVRRGDEVVLHGYRHRDTAPRGSGLRDSLERRLYTAGEGEFSRLDFEAARMRILRGLAVLRAAGWQPRGFVAPAWLMSVGTLEALEELPLHYCATRDDVTLLGSGERIRAPSLVVSTRAAWRRALSPVWNQARSSRYMRSPVLRAALHPADIRYRAIERLWRRLLTDLRDRQVVTEGQLVQCAARP
jgi:predicted deacetylase